MADKVTNEDKAMLATGLQCLDWELNTDDVDWFDGMRILAAVWVENRVTGHTWWEYAVVHIQVEPEEDDFDDDDVIATVGDSTWCWDLDDIEYFVEIE